MGGACSAYGGRREGCTGCGWRNVRERAHWGDLDVDRRIIHSIKMGIQEVGCGDMDWIELAQDRYSWLAFVNAAMNVRVL
jgi:hypothetical protein